jgi:hypothetical protein
MTSASGRNTLAYLVRCALPASKFIFKKDQFGKWYRFDGEIGVAPGWESGKCDTDCQEWVSACLMAHINLDGKNVPIWLAANNTAINFGTNASYPNREGGYFGNLFLSPPVAYGCKGPFAAEGVTAGRMCGGRSGCPYRTAGDYCISECSYNDSGTAYTACAAAPGQTKSFTHVITTYLAADVN